LGGNRWKGGGVRSEGGNSEIFKKDQIGGRNAGVLFILLKEGGGENLKGEIKRLGTEKGPPRPQEGYTLVRLVDYQSFGGGGGGPETVVPLEVHKKRGKIKKKKGGV